MSCIAGSNTPKTGLIFNLDAASKQSYPYHPSTNDHGISEWYCFSNATITYSCVYPYTTIYQTHPSNGTTVITTTSSNPTNGSFSALAGYRYYANKATNFVAEALQFSIAPLSMAGTIFIYVANRASYESGMIYLYAPFADASINLYKDGTGVNGTAINTMNLSKGASNTFSTSALGYYFITSTTPVIATTKQIYVPDGVSLSDQMILSPAKTTSYRRFSDYSMTSINTAVSGGTNYIAYDATYPVFSQNIADGAGGDATQGLPYEYLCDRYSFGNVVSDYVIAAPYPNTYVTTSYWDSTNSRWVIWDSHSLNGTQYNPAGVARDGTLGSGVDGTTINGLATNMASGATLWKWEGNNPFYLCINDSGDDEFGVLGWMSSRRERTISDLDLTWYDKINNNNVTSTTISNYQNNGYFNFNGTTQNFIKASLTSNMGGIGSKTILCWCWPDSTGPADGYTGLVGMGARDGNAIPSSSILLSLATTTSNWCVGSSFWGNDYNPGDTNVKVNKDSWNMIGLIARGQTTINNATVFCYNSTSTSSVTGSSSNYSRGLNISATNLLIGCTDNNGGRPFKGKIGQILIYNRELSSAEITTLFNTYRTRFNL